MAGKAVLSPVEKVIDKTISKILESCEDGDAAWRRVLSEFFATKIPTGCLERRLPELLAWFEASGFHLSGEAGLDAAMAARALGGGLGAIGAWWVGYFPSIAPFAGTGYVWLPYRFARLPTLSPTKRYCVGGMEFERGELFRELPPNVGAVLVSVGQSETAEAPPLFDLLIDPPVTGYIPWSAS